MKLRPAPPERNLVERSEILDAVAMARVVRRIAFENVERNGHDAYFVGMDGRDLKFAPHLSQDTTDDSDLRTALPPRASYAHFRHLAQTLEQA